MPTPTPSHRSPRQAQVALLISLVVIALAASACGSRLSGLQAAAARGASGASGVPGSGGTSATRPSTIGASGNLAPTGSAGSAGSAGTSGSSGTAGTAGSAGISGAGAAGTAPASATAPCGATGSQTPAGGNGGATATGVTASTITVGNIASISGAAPGITQSAQQATQAWAAYVNSQGGICGRQIKVQPFDDGNDSGTNFADAQQACSSDFAMVGNASGFDDGGAQAVGACGIPVMGAEVGTAAAGGTADIFGANPGFLHSYPVGGANYLKATDPTAVAHAGMIYLQVGVAQSQETEELNAYKSAGFNYVYQTSTTPTNANYAAIVQAMKSAGVQYVTEISDSGSAERLLEAMQQANFNPPVVDWYFEEYSPQFAQQTEPESNGNLVLMNETSDYEEASSNPGLQLMETWMNRVAPGYHQDPFAMLAWSAGLAFEQAAKEVGPDLTRPALISKIQGITNWTGGGVTPPVNIGQKIPSKCFFYLKIENGAYQRVYPTAPNTYDCTGSLFQY
jgi:ABC-type branched-subunit amino acid transport system substrate-binding protein